MKLAWKPKDAGQPLSIVTKADLLQQHPDLAAKTLLIEPDARMRYTKIMLYQGVLSGSFVIPKKQEPIEDRITFGFVLADNCLYFVQESGDLSAMINAFMTKYERTVTSPVHFLLLFMNYMIQEDIYFLEDYNERLQDIEDDVFDGHCVGMERFIMMARKDMNTLGNYYLQLSAVGQTMQQTIIPQNDGDENAMISLFLSRCSQLLSLVDNIKDNTSQIWNLRQTQLSDKQNKISTLLTIITTLFLPITFITGWYGMNFEHMPLLHNPYGYAIIICVVVVLVFVEIRFIKARHWLSTDADEPDHHERHEAKKAVRRELKKDLKDAKKDMPKH